jgi:hypothetical protein
MSKHDDPLRGRFGLGATGHLGSRTGKMATRTFPFRRVSPTALEVFLPPEPDIGAVGGGFTVAFDSPEAALENEKLLETCPTYVAYHPRGEIAITVLVPDTDPKAEKEEIPERPGKRFRIVATITDQWWKNELPPKA